MTYGTRAQFEAVRELAFGSISGTYAALGTALTENSRITCICNSTDVDIYISVDGINNNFRLASNSFRLIDFSTNKIRDDGLFVAKGTLFYAKQAAGGPTRGNVWLEVISANGAN